MVSRIVGALVMVLMGVALSAQGTPGYQPVTEIPRENLPASPLVYAAYGFVWLALTAYVFMLWRRIGRVERELAEVNTKLTGRR